MNEKEIEAAKSLLKSKKYQIKVIKINGGLRVEHPERRIYPLIDGGSREYKLGENCLYFKSTTLKSEKDVFKVPNYAKRLAISTDVIRICESYNYNSRFLFFYHNEKELGETRIISLLDSPENEKDKELEIELSLIFSEAYLAEFPYEFLEKAKEAKVLEGYNFLLGIISS